MDSERAETYLRGLAEAELRRFSRDAPAADLGEAFRVRVVASAYAEIGAIDRDRAEAIVDEFATAVEVRWLGDRKAKLALARLRGSRRPTRVAPAAEPVSVAPVGKLLQLREGETDVDIYLFAAVTTPARTALATTIRKKPRRSRPPQARMRFGMRRENLRLVPGWAIPGIPRDLQVVDDTGQRYDVFFGGGGDDTWLDGQFALLPKPPGSLSRGSAGAAWLDVGTGQHSLRVDLTAWTPPALSTATAISLSDAELLLQIRTEVLLADPYRGFADGLPALVALIPALRAVDALPHSSLLPGRIAALCDRYRVPRDGVPDEPAALPRRWAAILRARDVNAHWPEAYTAAGQQPAAALLHVALPEMDGTSCVLCGIITNGQTTTLHGAFFGTPEQGYPDGPCIWLRDDAGEWHVVAPGAWSDTGVIVFPASVIPALSPTARSADILVISRTMEARASVPLTWWTS